ncbi:MAG: TonB-dependent receptor plug domain-containing protein, partial [bacterium]
MTKTLAIFVCCLMLVPAVSMAQVGATIEGVVMDDVGNPLPGANVYILGTPFGAATSPKGEFEITIPATATLGQEADLVVQFIGYQSSTAKITLSPGVITQDFTLAPDVLELSSVVVTGLGETLIKEKLGVSIAKVKPEVLTRSKEPNVVQALAGKAAGIQVTQTSGDAGTSSYIRIRGASSIDRETQPLFVVDGVPISNRTDYTDPGGFNGGVEVTNRAADINTEDIESVEILKGAAASAIYGSRASNGVVLITTKSGKPGKTKINYKFSVGATRMSNDYPLQTSFGQGTKGEFKKNFSRSWGAPLGPNDTVYDHLHEISGTGWQNENNITIAGGREFTSFFLSFGRLYQKGHWKAGNDYERYTARLKATQVITKDLKVEGNIAWANTDMTALQRGDNAIGLMLATLRTPPDFNNQPY